jgi:hypothetical protein
MCSTVSFICCSAVLRSGIACEHPGLHSTGNAAGADDLYACDGCADCRCRYRCLETVSDLEISVCTMHHAHPRPLCTLYVTGAAATMFAE